MKLVIPLYVEEEAQEGRRLPLFSVRPLLKEEPIRRSERLPRALALLENDLRQRFLELGNAPDHSPLLEWACLRNYDVTTREVRLELKSGSHLIRFFLAGYQALGRRLWFTPKLPELHFEQFPDQRLEERATEAFTRHFRQLEKGEFAPDPTEFGLAKRTQARLTILEMQVRLPQRSWKPEPSRLSSIFGGGDQKPDGETELRRVGHLLNADYPEELPRAIGRATEVEALRRAIESNHRQAVLLLGPRQVGKTAVVTETVWQMMEAGAATNKRTRRFWQVAPMRLISGMSFVGEWQERVEAICDFLAKKEDVLFITDLLALLSAGKSANSELNVAQLLKLRLENGTLRLLGEITPEAWRVLRERDRPFADLFQVLPVHEPSEVEIMRILIGVSRGLERAHAVRFSLEVVPVAYELHRRFAAEAAFPGKAAVFLQRLAVKHADEDCARAEALQEFRERSGLRLALIDPERSLDRRTIVEDLGRMVTGQDSALEAFADVLMRVKTRLQDPRRPFGVFLLLGPTGVGKTQCAKALATHLFGSPDRLLRFDMNEMLHTGAVSRLTGSAAEPDGLLTGAIRRQPFSVVLFDEIEKAAPEVLDVLLGVLDEGRLADALGRVADFTSSVLLLTSNLGVSEAGRRIGFGDRDPAERETAYLSAAQRFFRPEFFNRLDQVIPFRELDRDDLTTIARRLLAEVWTRDGLRQRQSLFDFTPGAADHLVSLGYHPQLGARALKRVIEREVAQPLAIELAARPPGHPLRIELDHRDDCFTLRTEELRAVPRTIFWPAQLMTDQHDPAAVLQQAKACLRRIERTMEADAPSGAVELDALTPAQQRYYHCREQVREVERQLRATAGWLRPRRAETTRAVSAERPRARRVLLRLSRQFGQPHFREEREAERHRQEMEEAEAVEETDMIETPLIALVRELILLDLLIAEPRAGESHTLRITVPDRECRPMALNLAYLVTELFRFGDWGRVEWDDQTKPVDYPHVMALQIHGIHGDRLLLPLLGRWMLLDPAGTYHLMPVQMEGLPSSPALVMTADTRRLYAPASGLLFDWQSEIEAFRAFLLALLPLPVELQHLHANHDR